MATEKYGLIIRMRFVAPKGRRRSRWLEGSGQINLKNLHRDNPSAVEVVIQPEARGERVMGNGAQDAIFEGVAGLEAEDADGFDADVLVSGKVNDGGIRAISDGAWQDVRGAAARMRNVHHWDFDRFEGAVEIEVELRELADAELAVDSYERVNFLAAVAVSLESYFGFEQFNLRGMRRFLGFIRFFCALGRRRRRRFLLWSLGACRGPTRDEQKTCRCRIE